MRVSTSQIYALGAESIGKTQSELLQTQQQIASMRRILTPSDDPIGAATAVGVRQTQAGTDRYDSSIATAKDALGQNDTTLTAIVNLLQNARTTTISAGNSTLNDSDRATLANDLSQQLQQLLGLANSKDGNGNYTFSGFQVNAQPFVSTASGVMYNGDSGVRSVQVAAGRSMPISVAGDALFLDNATGNGTFTATAAAANTGTAIVGATQVVNGATPSGDAYQVNFNVAGGVTTYDVVDTTSATTVSTGNAYTTGNAIAVGGMQFTLTGAPASGDSIAVAPAAKQSVFDTLSNLVAALNTSAGDDVSRAQLSNRLADGLQNLNQALENVMTHQAQGGAQLSELDSLSSIDASRTIAYSSTLSRIEDLDYAKATTLFSQQQLALEAAQKSFLSVSGLSLFKDM
ncbi:MAG TPA: flagellar hook-associated protein FlgL [Casimicrobiaceae bacterium]